MFAQHNCKDSPNLVFFFLLNYSLIHLYVGVAVPSSLVFLMMSVILHQTVLWIIMFPVNFWEAGFALQSLMPSGSLPVCQEQCVDYSQTPPSLWTHGDRPSCDDALFRWSVKEIASLITLHGLRAAVICHPRDSKLFPTMHCETALNSTTPPLFIDTRRDL